MNAAENNFNADWSLRGKSAVVTGASRGIGRAVALKLAAAGANCLVHGGHDAGAADAVVDEICALGVDSRAVVFDLEQPSAQDALIAAAWQWREQVDIWINNAGIDVLTGAAASWTFEKKLDALWRLDVSATVRLAREVGRRMQQANGGVILNMGWDQAEVGMAGDSGEMFAAVKGAVMAFSRSLARSLAPAVRVNCLAPGWIRTRWAEGASEAWQGRAIDQSLLARWGTPDDVAHVAHFLVSPAASFLTGQVVPVNGGLRQF